MVRIHLLRVDTVIDQIDVVGRKDCVGTAFGRGGDEGGADYFTISKNVGYVVITLFTKITGVLGRRWECPSSS